MKKFFSFLFLLISISIFAQFKTPIIEDGFVDVQTAKNVALLKVKSLDSKYILNEEPLYLSYLDDHLYAYMFFFSCDEKVDFNRLIMEIENIENKNVDEEMLSLKDRVGYIIIAARKENNVILEYSKGIPYFITNWKKLKQYFNLKDGKTLYYLGFGRFFYEYKDSVLDLATYKTYNKIGFKKNDNVNDKWKKVLKGEYKISDKKSTNYIPNVPFVLWSYGCSPTSSSMIFSYYDIRGYGDFVDYYFTRYDNVLGSYRYNVPSTQRQLAILMNTDSVYSGGTSVYSIKPAHSTFANSNHPYSFTLGQHIYGQTSDTFFYRYIKNEIDSIRPVHWAVLNYYYQGEYIGHSVVGIGYDDGGTDTLVQVHNTWDYTEPFWNLYTYVNGELSYSCVYEVKPGGGNSFRTGNLNIDNKKYIKGLKGKIYFKNISDSLFSTKLYWTNNNFTTKNFINETFDTFSYFTPEISGQVHISAEFYNIFSSLIATDGVYNPLNIIDCSDTNNINLKSYTFDLSNAYDMDFVNGKVWVCAGTKGLYELDLSDTTLIEVSEIYQDGRNYKKFRMINDSIFILLTDNALYSFNLKSTSLIDSFKVVQNISDVDIKDQVVFLTTQSVLYILNIKSDYNFENAGSFSEGTLKYYTSTALVDSIFYLTDLLNGIYIMKTSYPSNGVTKLSLFSTSYNESFCEVKDDNLFLAAVNSGIVRYNITDPLNPVFVESKNLGTINRLSLIENGLVGYNNTKGFGIYTFEGLNEISSFYPNNRVEKVLVDTLSKRVFVSDNEYGVFFAKFSPYYNLDEKEKFKDFWFSVDFLPSGKISINYLTDKSLFGKIKIYNSAGRLVYSTSSYFVKNKKELILSPHLSSGTYFIRIELYEGVLTKKFTFIN
ncbi:MAG: C39 family peptidase [candidate division WOR-3 bacterium]